MAVITLTITRSPIEIVSGIPLNISVTANIPSTIFYTLNGEEPDTDSNIVVGSIKLPTSDPGVTFKAFATNGTDSSAIITQVYGNTSFSSLRRPHDKVIGLDSSPIQFRNLEPFGVNSPNPNIIYGNTGGIVVDSFDLPNYNDGYDGTGTGSFANGTDEPLENYEFIYSESNYLGERGKNLGTLPAQVTIRVPAADPANSNIASKLFNPRAHVIFQDNTVSSENPDVVLLNRPIFSLGNPSVEKDGVLLDTTAFEGSSNTGSFVRQFYNAREGTITYYFYDNSVNRWIISKENYTPKNDNLFNYSQVVFPNRATASEKVYKWIPFMSRRLI
jgi:hypothetical protein